MWSACLDCHYFVERGQPHQCDREPPHVSNPDQPKPETAWTFCEVCNCVLWVETVDAHMAADHGEPKPEAA